MANPKTGTQSTERWYYIAVTVIVLIIIGLITGIIKKKGPAQKSYDTASLEKIITESKIKAENKPDSKPKGKIIQPPPQYEIDQLRRNLNLPEKEEKDTREQHEEILQKDPQARFVL